ncbi:hypothetical protein NBRC13296_12065 [Paenibacillus chitinolyticus]|uniref:hypothetical protein n=1 Tax=Paenibacillus chitinolyticus TaxID=79263 RepID=UPI003556E9E8
MSIRRLGDMRIKPGASGDVQPSDVRAGKTFSSEIDTDQVGTLPDRGAMTLTASGTGQVVIPDGIHSNSKIAQVNVPADKVLTGTAIASVAGTMPNRGAPTFNVSPNNQTITPGYYTGGTVAGDVNIRPENIKKGVWIGGVQGNSLEYGAGDWISFGRIQKYRLLQRWEKTFAGSNYVLEGRPSCVDNRYVCSMSYYDGTNRFTLLICWDVTGTEVWRHTVPAGGSNYALEGTSLISRDRAHVFWSYGNSSGNTYSPKLRKIRLSDGATIWDNVEYIDQTAGALQETADGKIWLIGSFYTSTTYSAITRYSASGTLEAKQTHSPGNGPQIVVQPDGQYYYLFDDNRRLRKFQATGTTSVDAGGNYFGKEQWSLSLSAIFRSGQGAFWAPALGQVCVSGGSYAYANNGEAVNTGAIAPQLAFVNQSGVLQGVSGVPCTSSTGVCTPINDGEFYFMGDSSVVTPYILRTSDKAVVARFDPGDPNAFGANRSGKSFSWDFGNCAFAITRPIPNNGTTQYLSLHYLNTYFG